MLRLIKLEFTKADGSYKEYDTTYTAFTALITQMILSLTVWTEPQ